AAALLAGVDVEPAEPPDVRTLLVVLHGAADADDAALLVEGDEVAVLALGGLVEESLEIGLGRVDVVVVVAADEVEDFVEVALGHLAQVHAAMVGNAARAVKDKHAILGA